MSDADLEAILLPSAKGRNLQPACSISGFFEDLCGDPARRRSYEVG
jgi:hypothetical protein